MQHNTTHSRQSFFKEKLAASGGTRTHNYQLSWVYSYQLRLIHSQVHANVKIRQTHQFCRNLLYYINVHLHVNIVLAKFHIHSLSKVPTLNRTYIYLFLRCTYSLTTVDSSLHGTSPGLCTSTNVLSTSY